MRTSKSRSRSKSSRNSNSGNRSVGNIVNRVFDSSGPEGKVRGTPQQIIDKYNQLARDAQLSNDRVAAENFQQHAEHYTRMLGEAQREADARREQHEAQQAQHQQNRSRDDQGQYAPQGAGQDEDARTEQGSAETRAEQREPRQDERREQPRESRQRPAQRDLGDAPQPDLIEHAEDEDSGLVETPESAPAPKPRPKRAPRKLKPVAAADTAPDAPKAAE